jgi:hypothetical protein
VLENQTNDIDSEQATNNDSPTSTVGVWWPKLVPYTAGAPSWASSTNKQTNKHATDQRGRSGVGGSSRLYHSAVLPLGTATMSWTP